MVSFLWFAQGTTAARTGTRLVKLVKRAEKVQIPCQEEVAAFPPLAQLALRSLHQIGADSIHRAPHRGSPFEGLAAMDTFRIDEIARRLLERVPPALRTMRADLESNFRAVLRERLSKLDLVSRDEFDAQTRVLERTRAQLEALEARLAALEGSPPATMPRGPGSGATSSG
jgi:BMFP domain-containing protein YqiC